MPNQAFLRLWQIHNFNSAKLKKLVFTQLVMAMTQKKVLQEELEKECIHQMPLKHSVRRQSEWVRLSNPWLEVFFRTSRMLYRAYNSLTRPCLAKHWMSLVARNALATWPLRTTLKKCLHALNHTAFRQPNRKTSNNRPRTQWLTCHSPWLLRATTSKQKSNS